MKTSTSKNGGVIYMQSAQRDEDAAVSLALDLGVLFN